MLDSPKGNFNFLIEEKNNTINFINHKHKNSGSIIKTKEDEGNNYNYNDLSEKEHAIQDKIPKSNEKAKETKETTDIRPVGQQISLVKNNEKDCNGMPNYYSLKYIKENYDDILKESSIELSEEDEKLIAAENEMLLRIKKKIKIEDDYYLDEEGKEDNEKAKKHRKGRKTKDDQSQREHNEFSDDNIMKKVKRILFKFLNIFVNNIIEKYIGGTQNSLNIQQLDNKCILDLKVKENRKYLNQTIRELLSKDKNRHIIEKIMKKESNNEVINYVFNLKFKEWIDIITLKKDINCFGDISKDSYEVIKSQLPLMKDLLEEISKKKNKNNYLSLFFFYLINYERWFYIKNSRGHK
jgi:hypothetical protein